MNVSKVVQPRLSNDGEAVQFSVIGDSGHFLTLTFTTQSVVDLAFFLQELITVAEIQERTATNGQKALTRFKPAPALLSPTHVRVSKLELGYADVVVRGKDGSEISLSFDPEAFEILRTQIQRA